MIPKKYLYIILIIKTFFSIDIKKYFNLHFLNKFK